MVLTSLLARPPIKWAPTLQKALRQEERKKSRDVRKQKVYRSYVYPQLQSFKDMTSSGMMKLQSMERAERYLFEHSDLKLGSMQVKFINVMKIACLKNMFKDDLIQNMAFLQEKFGIKEMHDTVASLFPRRSGKTLSVAVFFAIMAVSQPDFNCVIYNLTSGQAEEFLAENRKYLDVFRESPEFGWVAEKEDVRRMIRFRSKKFNTQNSIKAYACALKGDGKIRLYDSLLYNNLYKGEVHTHTHTSSSFLFLLCFIEFWFACEERVLCTIPFKLIECLAPVDA